MSQSERIHRLSQPASEAYAPEHTATYTLDRQIAEARAEMGEDRWAQLHAEFDAVALSKEDYHG